MQSIKTVVLIAALLFTSSTFASSVNINVASAEKIAMALKGVGIKKAEAIVSYRQQFGLFKTAADLVNVKGIGPATLKSNQSDILLK